jgi:hypothetical protein
VVVVQHAERFVSGEFVGGILALTGTLTTVHQNGENLHRYRLDSLVRATRTAVIIESAVSDSKISTAEAICVHPWDVSAWIFSQGRRGRTGIVLLVALVVKMGGIKLQLQLLKNLPKKTLWLSNVSVFCYEYVMALLVRMMLLSIPSQSTAIYLSLFNAAVELMARTWFFVGYISTGGKQLAGFECDNSTFHCAYVRREQLRVIDGCNAAVVEYLTMLGAAAVVGILSGSQAFNLPTHENVVVGSLLKVLGVQVVAELVMDTFVFALEAKGGLVPLQLQHWKTMSLGVVCIQFFLGISVTASVLGALLLGVS